MPQKAQVIALLTKVAKVACCISVTARSQPVVAGITPVFVFTGRKLLQKAQPSRNGCKFQKIYLHLKHTMWHVACIGYFNNKTHNWMLYLREHT